MRASPLVLLLIGARAFAAPAYPWLAHAARDELAARFAPPSGTTRAAVAPGSFGEWLRHLPLLPDGAQVHLFDGRLKSRQDVHAAVVDLDVGARDLQQCADAVMRLYAEWAFSVGRAIAFHPDPGKPRAIAFAGDDRAAFRKFLVRVMADAGSASLAAELRPRAVRRVSPGDVLIQGGYPGHAVLVLDVATGGGKTWLLLGQSYMPAQEFHVLRNPAGGVWYDAAALDGDGLRTPEWRPFFARDLRAFEE